MISTLTLLAICAVGLHADANPLEPYFRNDYRWDARQQAFYKIHIIARSWQAARQFCEAEGAQLVYPDTSGEADHLRKIMDENLLKHVPGIWLGAHDLLAEGVYVTLEGEDIGIYYGNWREGEPSNSGTFADDEDCMAMFRDTTLNDAACTARLPAICRKRFSTLTSNPDCETADMEYVPNVDKSRCYKVHTQARNWSEAYFTCQGEQSYLTIINSKAEAEFLVNLLKKYPVESLKGNFYKHHVAVGFHDLFSEGEYITIHGQSLAKTGYDEWQGGMPDNYKGCENCGSIERSTAKLNDMHCSARVLFICEREIGDANAVDLFSRFGDNKTLGGISKTIKTTKRSGVGRPVGGLLTKNGLFRTTYERVKLAILGEILKFL